MNEQPADSIRILLIEDNPGDARLVTRGLREVAPELEVECVKSLSQGMERLATAGVDVLLLDLSLPDAHMLEALGSIRRTYPHIPVIILSGADDSTTVLTAARWGARDYFVKGRIDYNALHEIIIRERETAKLSPQARAGS